MPPATSALVRVLALVSALSALAPVAVRGAAPAGFLKIDQGRVVAAAGASAGAFRGVGFNVAGWLGWEPTVLRAEGQPWDQAPSDTTAMGERSLSRYLDSTQSAGTGELFFAGIRQRFITQEDVREMAALGANIVRVPVAFWHFPPHEIHSRLPVGNISVPVGFYYLDRLLEWAEAANMYVVIALRDAPGCQNTLGQCSESEEALMFDSIDATVQLWTSIASRYVNRTVVAGFDLLSSPEGEDGALATAYKRIIAGIRTVDTNHVIWVAGNELGARMHVFDDRWVIGFPNVAYSFNMFASSRCPLFSNYKTDQEKYLNDRIKVSIGDHLLPAAVMEFGGDCEDWLAGTLSLLQNENQYGPFLYWTFKGIQSSGSPTNAMFVIKDESAWISLLSSLTQERFTAPNEFEAGFAALSHSNFERKTEFTKLFQDFAEGTKIDYTWLGWLWITLMVLAGLVVAAGFGFLFWRCKKGDDWKCWKGKYDL